MTTTAGLTEDTYKTAVAAAVDLVREKHPDLDVRAGTAVRALVVEPGALLDAAQQDVVNRLRTAMSLKAMAREATVPREDAEAVLSNFGITLGGGTKATGRIRINLLGTAPVTVRAGITFATEDSVEFVTTETVSASVDPASGEEPILSTNDGYYYFTVPAEAVEVGSSGNIRQGHAVTTSVILSNYVSAEAFSDFSGGEDGETVASAVARIPSALAYRGLTNALSVRAQLSASLPDPAVLRSVSCVGHRDSAQLRDKHNPLGIAVGGRVDVYARLFDAPGVLSFVVDGDLVTETADPYDDPEATTANTIGTYRIQLPEALGFYAVKYVGPADEVQRESSLDYTLVRTSRDGAADAHDFDVETDGCETAWSAYQSGYLLVQDSADGREHLTALATGSRPQQKAFKVDLFWTDGILSLQTLIDDPTVSNVAADYVVRTPAICLVSVVAAVRLKAGVSVSSGDLEDAVSAYVNGRSFVPRLTRSELSNVLLQHGVESVDLSAGGMYLGGRVCGADGVWYDIEGDVLDVSRIGPERAMLTTGTVVFAAEPGAVQVNIVT